jgi:cobyrinic acid a,c-diamide synthase
MLAASLPPDIALLAALPRAARGFPERHLGLVQAEELAALPATLDALANLVEESGWTGLPSPVSFAACAAKSVPRALAGLRIAVARDAAFSFLYRANLDSLADMGAECVLFSPLADEAVPAADALYLPGGYPELHAARLAGNRRWLDSLRAYAAAKRPILAECGGMMVLFDTLVTREGGAHAMAGLLPGTVTMRDRLAALGL